MIMMMMMIATTNGDGLPSVVFMKENIYNAAYANGIMPNKNRETHTYSEAGSSAAMKN